MTLRALAILLAITGSASAESRFPACTCAVDRVLPEVGAVDVPTNVRRWTLPAEGDDPARQIDGYELRPNRRYEVGGLRFTTGSGRDDMWPLKPIIIDVELRVAGGRTSTEAWYVPGRAPVAKLAVVATFARDVSVVRIDLADGKGRVTYYTTPDELSVCDPQIALEPGPVHVEVTAIDLAGNSSAPAAFDTAATPEPDHQPACHQHTRCGVGIMGLVLIAPLFVGIALAVVLVILARVRDVLRRKAPREPVGVIGAEWLAHAVRWQSRVITAGVAGWVGYAKLVDDDAVLWLIWLSPVVMIVLIKALARWIDARRVLRLLSFEGVAATTQRDELAIKVGHADATLRAAPWLVRRARRNALPKARL